MACCSELLQIKLCFCALKANSRLFCGTFNSILEACCEVEEFLVNLRINMNETINIVKNIIQLD